MKHSERGGVTEKERERETGRQRDRDRETERQRDREREHLNNARGPYVTQIQQDHLTIVYIENIK